MVPGMQNLTLGRALLAGTAAGAVAAVINAVIYATGVIDQSVETPAGGPIPLVAVIAFSLVPNILAGGLLWFLHGRAGDPVRTFRIVAIAVMVLSFLTPLGLAAPIGMIIALEAMHVVAGIAAVVVTPMVAARTA